MEKKNQGGRMSRADIQYLGIIKNILDAGSLGDNRTGDAGV